ncbi:uncharacterized protein [Amphiura filiformis]|uniref:uncharacterized protein n=1 Tax=Amphiura filiformis TaxID=82378 RepID=UPI003B2253B8
MSIKIGFEDACICWNEDNFRWYRTKTGEKIGKYCSECNVEWLPQKYMPHVSEDVPDAPRPRGKEEFLFLSEPLKLEANTSFQIQAPRTKIDVNNIIEIKPGDHVTWHRLHGMWHHAIVEEVRSEENKITVIEWTALKEQWTPEIVRSTLSIDGNNGLLFNQMYRIEYPDEITRLYDPDLVVARAKSRRKDTGYKPFIDNCETFATYCKTGSPQSHQVAWLNAKFNEYVSETAVVTMKSFVKGWCEIGSKAAGFAEELVPKEMLMEIANGCKGVASGVVIALESYYVVWDFSSAYEQRKNGSLSRDDYIEEVLGRVIEGLVTVGFALSGSIGAQFAIGSLAGTPFGPLGLLVCGVASGIICGAIGKVIGTWLGNVAGKIGALPFKDDKAVTSIEEISAGDHIIIYGWCLHPRCHAICIEHDGNRQEVKVIRNTYEKGVVQEWVPFKQVMFKVIYSEGSCLDANKVIQNALSKLGEHKYNIMMYNCKSFAQECKTTHVGVAFIPDLDGILLDKRSSDF